jgi:hypothetical protein
VSDEALITLLCLLTAVVVIADMWCGVHDCDDDEDD